MSKAPSDFQTAYAAWRADQPNTKRLKIFDCSVGYKSGRWTRGKSIAETAQIFAYSGYGVRRSLATMFVSETRANAADAPDWLKTAANRLAALPHGNTSLGDITDPWLAPLIKDVHALAAVIAAASPLIAAPMKFLPGRKTRVIESGTITATDHDAKADAPQRPATPEAKRPAVAGYAGLKAATPTLDQNFAILDALRLHYPIARAGYDGSASDQTIADALSVPVDWVAAERERSFGPADPGPLVRAARAAALLKTEIEALEENCRQAIEEAVATASARFIALLSAPHAASRPPAAKAAD
ncbi:MAG: hypothetical protein H6872_05655 [Methylobacteriaceae bacterium]|nr:hypothetical protein [Methylobacteriaceae bacterium]